MIGKICLKKEKILLLIFFCLMTLSLVNSAPPETPNQNYDCSSEILPYEIQIQELNQTIINLTKERDHYKDLSEHYKNLYEDKTVEVTNRELIYLNQKIENFYTEINNIKSELSFLKLTLKVSIPIISVTLFSLLGITIYLRKKMKKNDK